MEVIIDLSLAFYSLVLFWLVFFIISVLYWLRVTGRLNNFGKWLNYKSDLHQRIQSFKSAYPDFDLSSLGNVKKSFTLRAVYEYNKSHPEKPININEGIIFFSRGLVFRDDMYQSLHGFLPRSIDAIR